MKRKVFMQDFKAFISKGNVIDLGVAVVIGAAFNKIVTSLVNDIIMPLISLLVGGLNVSDWKWVIQGAVYDEAGNISTAETALNYGSFLQNVLDFLVVAFSIFVVLRAFSKLQNMRKNKNHDEKETQTADEQ